MLRHEWRPLGPKATEVTVPCVPSVDLVAIDMPDAPVGWVRLKVSVVSADPQVVGVSLLAASGQRFRLRKSGQGFDQILLRHAEAGHLEVSGLALSEVHVSLAPSSPWAARWRVAQAVMYGVWAFAAAIYVRWASCCGPVIFLASGSA